MSQSPDLLSLVITLRPLPLEDPAALLPAWWGRAAHALLLNVVRRYAPALAEEFHDTAGEPQSAAGDQPGRSQNMIRPFTASTLTGRFVHGTLDPQGLYTLRFTSLRSDLTGILWQAAQDGPLAPGQVVELDYLKFGVVASHPLSGQAPSPTPAAHWAALTGYADLSAALLLSKTPAPRRISLEFASPTTFKSGGKHQPLPLPELVFGSLLERWNAFAPIAFPPEARRYAAECLATSRYRLSTRSVALKGGGMRVGAVGSAVYTTLNYDRYWMSLMGVLAGFALFSGVGVGVSLGLGACRSWPEAERDQDLPISNA